MIFLYTFHSVSLGCSVVSMAIVGVVQIHLISTALTDALNVKRIKTAKREKNSFRLFIGLHVKCIFLERKYENNAKSLLFLCSLNCSCA